MPAFREKKEPKMSQIPDLTDRRYLDEIGWFLYHEKYGRDQFGGSYDAERAAYSKLLLKEILTCLERDATWLADKVVVSIGCGCTGDLSAFPAAVKVAIDPLLYVYQKLGLLIAEEEGSRTVYLSLGAENLPLLDDCADLVICRNALDHMPNPAVALKEIWRLLKPNGALFVSVDIGGAPTPDEPTVLSVESLRELLREDFVTTHLTDGHRPHSEGRHFSVRVVAAKKPQVREQLDKKQLLHDYEVRIAGSESKTDLQNCASD